MKEINILIVEDESIVAMELESYITKLGYTVVDTCSNAEDAFKIAAEHPIHILMMDIRIKGDLDGIETAAIIKKSHPHVEIIFLTAHLDDYNVDRAIVLNPAAYLSKPFNREELRVFLKIALFLDSANRCASTFSFYTKDKSYSFYSFYLFFLVYQQLTYLGLTQIYFPPYFVLIDIAIPVIKINLLIITSALFAMYFLKIHRRPLLQKGYKIFIFIALLEIIVLSFPSMYNLDIVILTGALFIVFNLFAGIFTYLTGYKQARLFIVGFTIVLDTVMHFFNEELFCFQRLIELFRLFNDFRFYNRSPVFASYVLMILDALGMTVKDLSWMKIKIIC